MITKMDYRNEVGVPIINHSNKVEQIEWNEVNSVKELGTTDRKGGFGSTNKY